ncbi:retrotransposon protein, putative, Ty3-gypsy sub-class [Hordeum vulgare]|nr:retrotransposon protein, putative, Ty3-gypsy sub-class [Hordeum vulgare]
MRMFEQKRNHDLMEFLRSMQAMVGQNNHNGARSRQSDFQRTKPPNFGQAADAIEPNDWLRTMEKKLDIAHCEEADKVPFATHYLEGPAAIWWDNTKVTWPCGEEITWERFKEAFRRYHIPTGVMKVKQREFLALT